MDTVEVKFLLQGFYVEVEVAASRPCAIGNNEVAVQFRSAKLSQGGVVIESKTEIEAVAY